MNDIINLKEIMNSHCSFGSPIFKRVLIIVGLVAIAAGIYAWSELTAATNTLETTELTNPNIDNQPIPASTTE